MPWSDLDIAQYEETVFICVGAWSSYMELEEKLSYDELLATYRAIVERDNAQFRKDAAIQGIEIPDNDAQEELERVMQNARILAGEEDAPETLLEGLGFFTE